MLILCLSLASAAVAYWIYCMILTSPTRASTKQILRVTSSPPRQARLLGPFIIPHTRPSSDHASRAMFSRAVNTYPDKTTAAGHPSSSQPLRQLLLPSSSPTVPSVSQNMSNRVKGAPLRPTPANVPSNPGYKPLKLNAPCKRTASGLAKALGSDGPPVFKQPSTSLDRQISTQEGDVFYNENDFDSDPDLEVDNPSSKAVGAYPKLPQPNARPTVTYPPLNQKAHFHVETQDSGFESRPLLDQPPGSSAPLPWSSSPDYPQAELLLGQYSHNGQPSAPQELKIDSNPRPPKRRTLPWLEVQSAVDCTPARNPSATSHSRNFTPLPKDTPSSRFPWNTTASAIKEQQKQFRKTNNKKVIKENDGSEESKRAAIDAKKAKSVARPLLSKEQRRVLDLVVEDSASIFFTGSAGTGKSVLLREIIAVLRKKYTRESDRVAITASTGLAACNIGGVTLHSFAGIGLGKEDIPELVKKIKRNQKAKHRWMRTKVLIVDEISMVDGDLFDKLEAIGRTLRNNGRPFGGIQLVITGDFFQLPPVPDGRGATSTFAFDAKTWDTTINHTIGLHHVFRQKDPAFANMLNEMREGRLTPSSIATFKELSRQPLVDDDLNLTTTELFPTRQEVEAANRIKMNQLGGQAQVYQAKDGGTMPNEEQRCKLLDSSLAPRELSLKKGAQVMLIKNIDETLVNGSLGKVVGFMSDDQFGSYIQDPETCEVADPECDLNNEQRKMRAKYELTKTSTRELWPVVRFAIADGTTRDLLCIREVWKTELPNGEVQASRAQVPLILAWALSIHKAQGQTLERVKVDLGKVFEKGQAYVALSRATCIQGLQVLRFDPSKVQAHPKVRTFYSNLARVEVGQED